MKEEEINRHEYDLMDRRLGEQRIIDELKSHFEERIVPIEEKVIDLENSRRTYNTVFKTVGIGAPAVGSIAWFVWELGKTFGRRVQ